MNPLRSDISHNPEKIHTRIRVQTKLFTEVPPLMIMMIIIITIFFSFFQGPVENKHPWACLSSRHVSNCP